MGLAFTVSLGSVDLDTSRQPLLPHAGIDHSKGKTERPKIARHARTMRDSPLFG
jgi:hypothetical protein